MINALSAGISAEEPGVPAEVLCPLVIQSHNIYRVKQLRKKKKEKKKKHQNFKMANLLQPLSVDKVLACRDGAQNVILHHMAVDYCRGKMNKSICRGVMANLFSLVEQVNLLHAVTAVLSTCIQWVITLIAAVLRTPAHC